MLLSALFIGDSITAAFDVKSFFNEYNFVNKAVSGDSTLECIERIEPSYFTSHHSYIFVCIGTNDIARERTDSEISHNISKIILELKAGAPNAQIVLTSIFPTRNNEPRPNTRILKLNERLLQLSNDMKILFFNLHPHFTDAEGKLASEFTEDGLHLTAAAYRKWADELIVFLKSHS